MKSKLKKIMSICISCVLAFQIFTVMPIQAQTTEWDTMLEQLGELERYAISYKTETGKNTSVDSLVLNYLRSGRYNTFSWFLLAGSVDANFKNYVDTRNSEIQKLRTKASITIPTTQEKTDIVHMFGTMSAIVNNLNEGNGDMGGWLGDASSVIKEYKNNSVTDYDNIYREFSTTFRSNVGSFGMEDWIGDLDAYNICKIRRDTGKTYQEIFTDYFSTINENQRVDDFVRTRLSTLDVDNGHLLNLGVYPAV